MISTGARQGQDRPMRRGRTGRPGVKAGLAAAAVATVLAACSSGGSSGTTTSSTRASAAGSGSSGSGTSGGSQAMASTTISAPPPSTKVSASNPLVVDAAGKHVSMFVTLGQGGGLTFDGDLNGKLVITVPVGWAVDMQCHNAGPVPHSCAIVSGAATTQPAFAGAETTDPSTGMTNGQSQSFSFTASTAGTYRLVCLVSNHEGAGMWATFVVSATATAPQIQP